MAGENFRLIAIAVVADEAGSNAGAELELRRRSLFLACRAGALALLRHQIFKSGSIYFNAFIPEHVSSEVQGKAISVIELKGDVAGYLTLAALLQFHPLVLKQAH